MPKYSFVCGDCGKEFIVQCSWQEKDQAQCPYCGSSQKRQIFSSVGVITGQKSPGCPGLASGNCKVGGFS